MPRYLLDTDVGAVEFVITQPNLAGSGMHEMQVEVVARGGLPVNPPEVVIKAVWCFTDPDVLAGELQKRGYSLGEAKVISPEPVLEFV